MISSLGFRGEREVIQFAGTYGFDEVPRDVWKLLVGLLVSHVWSWPPCTRYLPPAPQFSGIT